MKESKAVLKYVGTGSLIEIPARDLTEQDLENIKWTGWDKEKLIESKLYVTVERLEQEQVLEKVYEQVTAKEVKEEKKFDGLKTINIKETRKRGKNVR